MIDERMQEQAALHVLGALTPAETRAFERAMQADAELKAFVASLSAATGALAAAVTLVEPPPQLRAKILAQLGEPQKMVSRPERERGFLNWLPWALATGLAAVCMMLFAQDSRLHQQLLAQQQQVSSQQEQIAARQKETIQQQEQIAAQQKTVSAQQEQIAGQQGKINSLNALAAMLQSATNDLQQTVAALQATNRLANLKIAMLNSLLADAPTAVAVTLWDDHKQEGVFVVQHLKTLPPDRDYQLWVLDKGTTPVDAGVFRVDANGSVRVEFKAKQLIQSAGKFAVTEEVRGGVAAPTIKNMVLVGG